MHRLAGCTSLLATSLENDSVFTVDFQQYVWDVATREIFTHGNLLIFVVARIWFQWNRLHAVSFEGEQILVWEVSLWIRADCLHLNPILGMHQEQLFKLTKLSNRAVLDIALMWTAAQTCKTLSHHGATVSACVSLIKITFDYFRAQHMSMSLSEYQWKMSSLMCFRLLP